MDGQTSQRADYQWPYPKPITFRPSPPPLFTKPDGFYMRRPTPGYCHCDTHQYDGEMNQYKALAKKEKILKAELKKLDEQMLQISNGVLDHPCDDDDTKLETIYQTDYKKRGIPLVTYTKLREAVDSKAPDPVEQNKIQILNGYRDPCSFRYTAIVRPTCDPPADPCFKTSESYQKLLQLLFISFIFQHPKRSKTGSDPSQDKPNTKTSSQKPGSVS